MRLFLRVVCALALAVWFGSMLFFSAGVAPVAFTVLPTRVLAGNLVGGVLATLQAIAYACGAVLVVGFALRSFFSPRRKLAIAKTTLAALMLANALYSGFAVDPPLASIRAEFGAIDALPKNDPERVRFFQLHQLSEASMGLNLLGGLVLLVLEQLPDEL